MRWWAVRWWAISHGALIALFAAAGGVAAVGVYRYIDLDAVGPFPDLYESRTDPEKTSSLLAEAALAALLLPIGKRRQGRCDERP